MKKLFLFCLIAATITVQSSPECIDYQGRALRQEPLTRVNCPCNCSRQPHSKIDDKWGYTCLRCGHKMLPTNPFAKKEAQ
jgi:hypothetical protein